MTSSISLDAAARELMDKAGEGKARRAARTVVGDHLHVMRQTLVAILRDSELAEHDSPGEATVQVLSGHVELWVGADASRAGRGDLIVIPPERHSLRALEDSSSSSRQCRVSSRPGQRIRPPSGSLHQAARGG